MSFEIYNEDCITWMQKNKGRQFDLSVFSPPFSSLYAYSNNDADMGNSRESDDEFLLHYKFFSDALFPMIKPGRNVCVHIQQVSRSKVHHGYIGLWDIRGEVIRVFEKSGFNFYGEVTIWKDPQAQSIRTKTQCLAFTQFVKDSMRSRPALADYLLIFKKPGDNAIPCTDKTTRNIHGGVERIDVSNDDWINWAQPIWKTSDDAFYLPYHRCWFGINEQKTLNQRAARQEEDERHLCPLQLDLIERCIRLWSNPGETVFTPFCGIGSEVYQSIKWGRYGVGTELKKEYYDCSINNCNELIKEMEAESCQTSLF